MNRGSTGCYVPSIDLHQDCDVEITDTYHWKAQDEVQRFDWEAGDIIYIPPTPFTSTSMPIRTNRYA